MFEVITFVIGTWVLSSLILLLLWRRLIRHWGRRVAVLIAVSMVCLPGLPYLFVEGQTALFLKSLKPAINMQFKQDSLPAARLMKVLLVTPHRCKVYCVVKDSEILVPAYGGTYTGPAYSGFVMSFRRVGEKWIYAKSDGIWTDGGSMEGNIFPPYPDKGYYLSHDK